MVKRVDYFASKQGYCGWETFSDLDSHIMNSCMRISVSQMERQIGEPIRSVITEL